MVFPVRLCVGYVAGSASHGRISFGARAGQLGHPQYRTSETARVVPVKARGLPQSVHQRTRIEGADGTETDSGYPTSVSNRPFRSIGS